MKMKTRCEKIFKDYKRGELPWYIYTVLQGTAALREETVFSCIRKELHQL